MKNNECLTNFEMLQKMNSKIEESKMDVVDKITVTFFGILTILAVIITIRMLAIPSRQYYTVERENNTIIVKEK